MSLKLRLKPNEKMIIGGAVLVNGRRPSEFIVENNVPILREGDIMGETQVTSPSRRLYFCVQLMYIDVGNATQYRDQFHELAQAIEIAAPSSEPFITEIVEKVAGADYYHALKLIRRLMNYEESLVSNLLTSGDEELCS